MIFKDSGGAGKPHFLATVLELVGESEVKRCSLVSLYTVRAIRFMYIKKIARREKMGEFYSTWKCMYSLVSEVSLKLEVGETSLFAIVFVKMTKNDIQIE